MQSTEQKLPPLCPLVCGLAGLIVVFQLGGALVGKSLFRASHLGASLEYADHSINLLRPVIVGFNATGTPTVQEVPIWQATAGLIFKATASRWYGWANLVSLAFFGTCIWPFFQIASQLCGQRAAVWAVVLFLSQPLIVVMSGEATTDGFCLAVTIWFLFFATKMICSRRGAWWFPASLFATLAAVSKLPFFMSAGIFTIFLLMLKDGRNWRLWGLLAGCGLIASCVFALWTHYTDLMLAQAVYPFVELRLSHSPAIVYWWFGDWHYRLSPGPWVKGAWRFLHATLGTLPMGALLVLALLRAGQAVAKLWLLATFLTILVFCHVVLVHWHYYLMCCPAVALLCAQIVADWEQIWLRHTSWRRSCVAVAGVVLVFSCIEGLIAMKIAADYDPFSKTIAALIREHTDPGDRLLVHTETGDWGGEELFRAGRQGLYVQLLDGSPSEPSVHGLRDLLNTAADLAKLKSLGYNKLVLISESPIRFAIEAVNPGSKRIRHMYPAHLTPAVDSWPTVYSSDDLLIKTIPDTPRLPLD